MFAKTADAIERILNIILLAVLTIMVTSICIQVVGRHVFSYSPSWTEEVARMSIAWITMLGSAAVLRKNGHIAVTVVLEAVPRRLALVLTGVRDMLILVMCGGLVAYGYGFAVIGGRRSSPALEIPMFYPFLAIPVGAALIALLLVLHRASMLETKEAVQ